MKGCISFMILKSKRQISKVQYLKNLFDLEKDVHKWCRNQPKRDDNYGLTDLFNYVSEAFKHGMLANNKYLCDEDSCKYRKEHFDEALGYIHLFNAQLTIIQPSYNIKFKKLLEWSDKADLAINQIEKIKKSDRERLTRILRKRKLEEQKAKREAKEEKNFEDTLYES